MGKSPCEDGRDWGKGTPWVRGHQKPREGCGKQSPPQPAESSALLTPFQISGPQKSERTNVCSSSHQLVALLWQPQDPHTPPSSHTVPRDLCGMASSAHPIQAGPPPPQSSPWHAVPGALIHPQGCQSPSVLVIPNLQLRPSQSPEPSLCCNVTQHLPPSPSPSLVPV